MAAHRYWRLNMTANGGRANSTALATLDMRTSVGGSNVATGGTAAAKTSFAGTPASAAFDGNAATLWSADGANPNWIQYDFGAGNDKDIVEMRLVARNDSYYADAPTAGSIDWSDDGQVWSTSATYSGLTFGSAGAANIISAVIENNPDYRVTAVEAQVAYTAPSDQRISAVEAQVAYSTRDLRFIGLETQAYTIEPSEVRGTGLEVQVWASSAQIEMTASPYFQVHRYAM